METKKTGKESTDMMTASKADGAGTMTADTQQQTASSTDGAQMQQPQQRIPENTKEGLLYKFFMDALKDMYFAENQILGGLQKMQEAATTEELQEAFEDHHLMTQKQISRLDKVFRLLGEKAEGKKCEAILGLMKEAENIIKETEEGSMTRDAALIMAAQKVEHYEIATYGGLVALAETLKLTQVADILDTTLQEEEDTDHLLTEIAESSINFEVLEDEELELDEEEDY